MIKEMDREYWNLLMVVLLQVNFAMEFLMVMENILIKNIKYRVDGKREYISIEILKYF
jgi:hypothetical protein